MADYVPPKAECGPPEAEYARDGLAAPGGGGAYVTIKGLRLLGTLDNGRVVAYMAPRDEAEAGETKTVRVNLGDPSACPFFNPQGGECGLDEGPLSCIFDIAPPGCPLRAGSIIVKGVRG